MNYKYFHPTIDAIMGNIEQRDILEMYMHEDFDDGNYDFKWIQARFTY